MSAYLPVPLIQHVRFRESPTMLEVVVEGRVTWGGTGYVWGCVREVGTVL